MKIMIIKRENKKKFINFTHRKADKKMYKKEFNNNEK